MQLEIEEEYISIKEHELIDISMNPKGVYLISIDGLVAKYIYQ